MSADTNAPTPEQEGLKEQLSEGYRLIGRSPVKVDGMAKTTGATQFADDLTLPRMLFAKLYRSPVAHARIVSIDTSEAEALPGVEAVLTGEALPTTFGILPVSQDEHALCVDKVRFVGDPVAAVAAIDEETAFDAMNLIRVEYEPLEAVYEPAKAIKNEIEEIHDYGDDGNVHKRVSMQFGDVEQAFEDADLVLEHDYFYEGNTHLPMEQHATLAWREPDGRLTIWSSTQTPHYLHRAASKVLGLPASRVRIVACPNGGGFGGKSDPFNHEIAVAKLSMMTNRPVKICLTREEVFYCHRGRHPVQMHCKTGFTKDGAFTGMHFQSLLDGGAYGSYGVASTYYTGALQTVTYKVPTYRFDGVRTFTNKPPCGPKRGHGTPQPRFALEVQIDRAAEQLGLDPAQMRLDHLQPPHSVTANWLRIGSMGLGECIEKVVEGSGWASKYRQLPRGKGIGIACSSYICGAGLPIYWNAMPHSRRHAPAGSRRRCRAVLRRDRDRARAATRCWAMCAAEVLGVDLDDVRIHRGRHGLHAGRPGLVLEPRHADGGQRCDPGGRSAHARSWPRRASKQLQVPGNRLRFADNRVFDVQDPGEGTELLAGRELRRSGAWHHRGRRLVRAPALARSLSRCGRRSVAGLHPTAPQSWRSTSTRRPASRHRREGLDRPRHRTVHQRDARHRPGRGQRLHGPGRGADGGDGVSGQPLRRPQDPVAARVQEPDHQGDARRRHVPRRPTRIPNGPVRCQGGRSGTAAADHAGRRQLPSTTPSAYASTRSRWGRKRCCGRSSARTSAMAPRAMPDLRITETMRVKTEDEGGDGTAQRPPKKKSPQHA